MDSTLELQTLKLFLNKECYTKYHRLIPSRIFSGKIRDLYDVLKHLHTTTDREVISLDDLMVAYKLHGSPTTAKISVVESIMKELKDTNIPDIGILTCARDKEIAAQIADQAIKVMNSKLSEGTLKELVEFVQSIDVEVVEEKEDLYCSSDLDILREKVHKSEFKFGLDFLQALVPSPGRGQFMIVFASTNAGKSTLVSQLDVGYLEQGLKVLYIANEEPDYRIMYNHIRSAENKTEEEIMAAGKVDVWSTMKDRFYLVAAHDYTIADIEARIKEVQPDVLVIDQLDNVKATGSAPRHEQLEHLYQRTRVLAGKYDCLVVAVSQANDEASGKLKLKTNMMANSRIGKPATADLILGIGMRDMEDPVRCITPCKNKINGIHKEVYCKIDAPKARYVS